MKDGYLPLRQTLRLAPGQQKASKQLAMIQAVPPTIAVLDPKPGTLIRAPGAELKVEVKSRYRLSALRVGKENESVQQTFVPSHAAEAGETWTVEAPVSLSEGDNRIRLEAVDEHGTRAEQTVTLTRQSLVALELRGPPEAQVRVGNNRYTLDANGALALHLPPGTHQIDASKEGFTASRETVTLAAGQAPAQKRLALAPLPPPPPSAA
ncbi:MAG: PEGA domain-containing protein [Chloroflexota bacterium]